MTTGGQEGRKTMRVDTRVIGGRRRLWLAALGQHLHECRAVVGSEDYDAVFAPTAADNSRRVAQHLCICAVEIGPLELSVGPVRNRAAVRRPERFPRIL